MNYNKINVARTSQDIKRFINYIKHNNFENIAIDFEFHKGKDIRLMQLNFDDETIWIIYPLMKSKYKNIFLKKISEAKIIMNGAISLDIPFIASQLFKDEKEYLHRFLLNFEDVRYLCEYYSIINNNNIKCDIYSAYLNFGVIDKKTYDTLIENYEYMLSMLRSILWEKSTEDIWNIKYIDGAILYYAVNDVFYLINYSNKLHEIINNYEIINLINRYAIMDKYNIIETVSKYKPIIDKLNICFITEPKYKNLDIIYKEIFIDKDFYIQDINISAILKIYNLKTYLKYLLKIILYRIILNKYTVYIKKDIIYNKNDFIINFNSIDYKFKLFLKDLTEKISKTI